MSVAGLTLNYCKAELTIACVDSMLAQGVDPVLIWDNSDDQGSDASRLRNTYSGDGRVEVVYSERNLGFAAGVNRGLARIAEKHPGRRVLLLNNDAILLPSAVNQLMIVMDRSPHAWIAAPDVEEQGRRRGLMHYHRLLGLITERPLPGSFPYASGCCLLVNVPITGVQLFDEDFFMYGEDAELGYRIAGFPQACVHVARVMATHKGRASSGDGTDFYEQQMVVAHLTLACKLSSGATQASLLSVARWFFLCARAITRSVRLRRISPIRALTRRIG